MGGTMNKILELEDEFFDLAAKLRCYRRENGFNPGAKVIAKYRDEQSKHGVIPQFGSAWIGVEMIFVPVEFSDGVIQPWKMSDLTLVKEERD
jgi:hypothetical protein